MWPLYVQTAMTENIKTGTTESLGIRLTAQDVADEIAAAVEPSWLRRAHPPGALPRRVSDQDHGGGIPVFTGLADATGE